MNRNDIEIFNFYRFATGWSDERSHERFIFTGRVQRAIVIRSSSIFSRCITIIADNERLIFHFFP